MEQLFTVKVRQRARRRKKKEQLFTARRGIEKREKQIAAGNASLIPAYVLRGNLRLYACKKECTVGRAGTGSPLGKQSKGWLWEPRISTPGTVGSE